MSIPGMDLAALIQADCPARTLQNRLLVIDSSTAWAVGQSFKDLAKRPHSSLVRIDPDSGLLKINAYIEMWQNATKLT